MSEESLHLFQGYGIELEYMIVKQDTLDVLPIADAILEHENEDYLGDELSRKAIAWSNELVLHVIELKCNGPAASLEPLSKHFHQHILRINQLLKNLNGKLMPTAMHPWMNPYKETKLWPHDCNEIYSAYNRIFNCQGHGWSNLQSMHINLPFANDEEFGRLHAAIRLVLPILPALSASSPIVEGKITGMMDTRLETYRHNQKKVPRIAGQIIPEQVFTEKDYRTEILEKIFVDIKPYDIDNILQNEWLNSRGAIARFMRNAIEIRVLDLQECPLADISIAAAITSTIQSLVAENWTTFEKQKSIPIEPLAKILHQVIKDAEKATIDNEDYLKLFKYPGKSCTIQELWQYLITNTLSQQTSQSQMWRESLNVILNQGTLSRRILKSIHQDTSRTTLHKIYNRLCECLEKNIMFLIE